MAIAELEHAPRSRSGILDEVERAVVGKRDVLELVLHGLPRRRPRPARGLSGPGEDAARARRSPRSPSLRLPAHPVHARPDALRRHRLVDLQPAQRRLRVPARPDLRQPPARRRDQPRPAEDAGGAARGDAGAAGHHRGRHAPSRTARSSSSPRRTRSSTRAPTRCPRRSSTASCCGPAIGYPDRGHEWEVLERRVERKADEIELDVVVGRDTLLDMQRATEQVHVAESIGYYMVDVVEATRWKARACRSGASPRGSLALLKLSRCRAALDGPRLRHAGRRQVGRRPRADAPPHAAPGALGAAR